MSRSPEQLFERLASEIERLPQSSRIRKPLEVEYAYGVRWLNLAAYRILRPQVTAARTEVAKTDLHALKAELANQGGLIEWNLSLWKTRLDKWLMGYEASGFTTVEAFFDEASAIAEELDRQILKTSQSRNFRKPTMEKTGKTAREAKKRARHLQNKAARAEANRGHKKGPSPSADKGGQKGKKK